MSLTLTLIEGDYGNASALRVLRVLRVLRTIRGIQEIKAVQQVLHATIGSGKAFLNNITFLLFIVTMFGLCGMNLFGNLLQDYVRPNFDSFPSAVLSLFAVVTGDGFGYLMFECMQTGGAGPVVSPLFFLSYFCLVNYIVLNLFIAAVLSAFAVEKEEVIKRAILAEEKAERQRILDEEETARLAALNPSEDVVIDLSGLNERELSIMGSANVTKKKVAPKLAVDLKTPKSSRKKNNVSVQGTTEIPLATIGEPAVGTGKKI